MSVPAENLFAESNAQIAEAANAHDVENTASFQRRIVVGAKLLRVRDPAKPKYNLPSSERDIINGSI